MKIKRLLLLGLALCRLGHQTEMGQTVSPPNAVADQLQAILQAGAQKAGAKAVVFGIWVGDRHPVGYLK